METLTWKKRLAYSLLMLLVALVLLELGVQGINLVKKWRKGPDDEENRLARLSIYQDVPWVREYMREYVRVKVRPAPFYEWRKEGFQGKYINISPEGVRRTWNPEGAGTNPAQTVFCFGGSVMWGFGARDDFTIASQLAKKLNREGARFRVMNYGEPAYIFTQEIVYLLLLLKEGKIPDYVVFFDGVNDVYGAYQNGKVAYTHNFDITRKKLKMSTGELFKQTLADALDKNILTYKLVKQAVGRLSAPQGLAGLAASAYNDDQLRQLAQDIVIDYEKNLELVKALAKAYGFRYYCFWQPMLFSTAALTEEERNFAAFKDKKWVFLQRQVDSLLREKRYDHFVNLSTIFDDKQETVYLDFAHLSEAGNERVAEAMSQVILRSAPHE
jgi:lysophospholipase L1-like esterase